MGSGPLQLDHESLVRTANALPPLPLTLTRLMDLFADEQYDLRDVVRTVKLDATLVGRLLRLANSAAYGSRPTASTEEAILRVGSGAVLSIAMSDSVRPKKNPDLSAFDLTPDSYWRHAVACMACGQELSKLLSNRLSDELLLSALLHDFGKLVLSEFLTDDHKKALHDRSVDMPFINREMAVLSVNHAEVGAVVAQAWKLPESIARAVQYHHTPDDCGSDLCYGLCISNFLAWMVEGQPERWTAEGDVFQAATDSFSLHRDSLSDVVRHARKRLDDTLEAFA
ncbi:MAG: HDOD domain-containing protein [Planctomycetaceae bacterium]